MLKVTGYYHIYNTIRITIESAAWLKSMAHGEVNTVFHNNLCQICNLKIVPQKSVSLRFMKSDVSWQIEYLDLSESFLNNY